MFKISAIIALLLLLAGYEIVNAFDCCIDATSESDCNAVESGCEYIGDNEAALALSAGAVCVTSSWIDCTVNGNCPPPPPVPPVPSDCIIDTCDNTEDTFNVGFIVDKSGSVGLSNYKKILHYFVQKMITENLNDDDLVSLASFSDKSNHYWQFTSNIGDTNRAGLLTAIEVEKLNFKGGDTCLGPALKDMITDFAENLYSIPEAQRGKNNRLFILLDGIAICMDECSTFRQQLKDLEITTYLVGITEFFAPGTTRCLVEDQIKPEDPRYDSDKTSINDYILTIPDFDEKYFYSLEMQLRRTVCPPIVFEQEEDTFVNRLYVVLTDANDMIDNDYMIYIISLVLLIIGGLVYCFRERLCFNNNNGDKYIPLKDGFHGQYESV